MNVFWRGFDRAGGHTLLITTWFSLQPLRCPARHPGREGREPSQGILGAWTTDLGSRGSRRPSESSWDEPQINRSGAAPALEAFKDFLGWHLHLLVHPSNTRCGFTHSESQYGSLCSAGAHAAPPKAFIHSGCPCQHTHKHSPSAPDSK